MAWGLEQIDSRELTEWWLLFQVRDEEEELKKQGVDLDEHAVEIAGGDEPEEESDDVTDEELEALIEAELARLGIDRPKGLIG